MDFRAIVLFLYLLILTSFRIANAGYLELTPYINAGLFHDSNLFRVANDQEALQSLNTTKRSDSIFDFSPGVRGYIDHKQQKFFLDLSLLRRKYDHFDSLNFNGGDALLQWNWHYTRNWNGLLSYQFVKEQSDFSEQLGLLGDVKKINKLTLKVNRQLSPRYKLISGIEFNEGGYKRRELSSKEQLRYQLGLRYSSRRHNFADLVLRYTDATYPNRGEQQINRGLDDGYSTNELLTRVYWRVTGKSTFNFEAGYLYRDQDTITQDDFDGVIGKFSYKWALTKKTTLKSSVWRELSDTEDQIFNYKKVNGASLGLDWQLTPRIIFTTIINHENSNFQQSQGISGGLRREDDLYSSYTAFRYQFRDNIMVTASYNYQERDSTRPSRKYDNNVVSLFVEFEF